MGSGGPRNMGVSGCNRMDFVSLGPEAHCLKRLGVLGGTLHSMMGIPTEQGFRHKGWFSVASDCQQGLPQEGKVFLQKRPEGSGPRWSRLPTWRCVTPGRQLVPRCLCDPLGSTWRWLYQVDSGCHVRPHRKGISGFQMVTRW